MMTKTHMAVGVLTSIYLLTATNLPAIPIMLGTIGSIAPDFDFAFGHRKITHSLLGVCIAFILTWSISHIFAVSFSLNCLIHIALDSWTKMGVPLFYPYKKYYGLKEIKTGDANDNFLCLIIIFLITLMMEQI